MQLTTIHRFTDGEVVLSETSSTIDVPAGPAPAPAPGPSAPPPAPPPPAPPAPPAPPPPILGWSTTKKRGDVTVCANKTTAYGTAGFLQMLSEVARANDGDYYAEVWLFDGRDVPVVGLSGFATPGSWPGTQADEFTLYSYNGKKCNAATQTAYAAAFSSTEETPVVVGIRNNHGAISFSINGTQYPVAFSTSAPLRIVVGSATSASNLLCASVNVGQGRFLHLPSPTTQGWERTPLPTDPIFYGEHFVAQLHCILRPNASGQWYVQNDGDHAPRGFGLTVNQTADALQLSFTKFYPKAGAIQITPDDNFIGKVQAGGNLGLGNTTIVLKKRDGTPLNPSRVYLDNPDILPGDGNLWITAAMWE